MPTLFQDVAPTNPLLNDLSVELRQKRDRFKALALGPLHQVADKKGRFPVADINQYLRRPSMARVPAYGQMPMRKLHFTEASYLLTFYGLGVEVDRRELPSVPAYNIPDAANESAVNGVLMDFEFDAITLYTTLGNYLASNRTTLAGPTQFTQGGTSNPLQVFQTAKAAITLASEADYSQIAGPLAGWQALARHPQIQALPGYVDSKGLDQMTVDRIAKLLDFDRGVNLDVSYDSSPEGQPASAANISRAWGNHFICQMLDSNPSEGTSSHAVTLSYYPDLVNSDTYETPPYIDVYYADAFAQPKIVNQLAGYLIRDAV